MIIASDAVANSTVEKEESIWNKKRNICKCSTEIPNPSGPFCRPTK